MRRALLRRLPALTRFYYGAINPLTVEQYTLREVSEYLTQMEQFEADQAKQARRDRG